jgi:hypothetical protein
MDSMPLHRYAGARKINIDWRLNFVVLAIHRERKGPIIRSMMPDFQYLACIYLK